MLSICTSLWNISRTFHLTKRKPWTLNPLQPLATNHSTFQFCVFDYFGHLTWVESHRICLLMTGLFHFSIMSFRLTHAVAQVGMSFWRMDTIPLDVCTTLHVSISTRAHLGCSYVSAIVDNVARNVGEQTWIQDSAFPSLGYVSSSEIAGSMVVLFLILGGCARLAQSVEHETLRSRDLGVLVAVGVLLFSGPLNEKN